MKQAIQSEAPHDSFSPVFHIFPDALLYIFEQGISQSKEAMKITTEKMCQGNVAWEAIVIVICCKPVCRMAVWPAFTAKEIAKSQMSVSGRYGTVSKGQLLLA